MTTGRWPARGVRRLRPVWIRAGQLLGLVFLAGPVGDLAGDPPGAARLAVIVAALVLFVATYLALLPPVAPLARRGRGATAAAIALLAALTGLILLLGAPRSSVLLLVYAVAAAGLLMPVASGAVVTAAAAAATGGGLLTAGAPADETLVYVLSVIAIGTIMVAYGHAIRVNRELLAAREGMARAAVAEERLRFARDLHDLLGHSLSLLALKGDLAGRLVRADPDRAEREIRDLQRIAREALTEVREAVRGYRRPAVAAALDRARAALEAAGIACRVERDARDLPADVEGVLAFAVREAATNVARHSAASACTIRLVAGGDRVDLEVRDDGRGADDGGAGTGLVGLGERVARVGGTLAAGSPPEGGFRLRLSVPVGRP
ncbi:MAG: sensor histidine kinase [Thermoleophilia bacterium]